MASVSGWPVERRQQTIVERWVARPAARTVTSRADAAAQASLAASCSEFASSRASCSTMSGASVWVATGTCASAIGSPASSKSKARLP